MTKNKTLFLLFFLLITLTSWLLYQNAFTAYFFQDDWYTLSISKDPANFFIPNPKIIYYRPLGMQIPFFLLRSIFGLNVLPFHLLTFFTIILNSYLAYLVSKIITKKTITSLLITFLYSTSTIHFIPMYWTSTYAFVLGTTFFLLSFIFYLSPKHLKGGRMDSFQVKESGNPTMVSLFLYSLGLLTNELVITLPAILFAYELILGSKNLKKAVPFGLLSLFYLGLRFFLFAPPTKGDYIQSIGINIIHNAKAYFLWSFNLPDEIKAQFLNFFQINPQFIKDFPSFTTILLVTFFINLIIYLLGAYKNPKIFFFGFSWFLLGLTPVIFFPKHSFSYYLEISLIGLLLPYALFISRFSLLNFSLLSLFLLTWVISSFNTIKFNELIHWAPQRAANSLRLITEIKKKYPNEKSTVYVLNTPENRYSLNGEEAVKVFFKNPKIRTIYTQEAPGKHLIR